ncbi:MAG TPA: NAD(P)-dependent oxidoreductase [Candidatus Binatia bacterium]|jgi:nucleoside-diphosphate-sugar epimerase
MGVTLVTGAGLVGTSFGQCALKRGESLVFVDPQPRQEFLERKLGRGNFQIVQKDVRDLPALIEAIKAHKIETVVHTAGLIGPRVAESLYTGFHINVLGTMNVAEAVRLTGIKRLVHISTFGVYDWRRPAPEPVNEDFYRGSGVPYGNSKVAKELLLEAYQRMHQFELMVMRPANVYGLGHFWSGSGGGEKIQSLLASGIKGEPAQIPQEQTMAFEYIYSKDLGRAVDLAATVPVQNKNVFNIGEGKVTQFEELVGIVKTLLPRCSVEIVPGTPPVSRTQHLDISRAKTYLGWEPQYTMESAFADYIEDLRQVLSSKE